MSGSTRSKSRSRGWKLAGPRGDRLEIRNRAVFRRVGSAACPRRQIIFTSPCRGPTFLCVRTVTTITPLSDALCFDVCGEGEATMTNARTHDLFGQVPLDERNERPLVVALVAIVVAWLALFVATLA